MNTKKTLGTYLGAFIFLFSFTGFLAVSQVPVTRIYTDHGGFLMSSTSSIQSPDPSTQNLLAFQTGSTVWATGVNNAILAANSVTFTSLDMQAMPVTISGMSSSALIGIGRNYGGYTGSNGCVPAVTPPQGANIANYLVDGPKGLDISTGVFNIGGTINYTVSSIQASSIGDGIPDIIITQIGDLSNSSIDKFRFKNASNITIGNQIDVNFSTVGAVMRPNWKFYNSSTLACGASTASVRETRILTFDFADLGITVSNFANISRLEHILSPNTDLAFVAYNKTSVVLLPISLLDFEAELINREVHLWWQTASEQNSDLFQVERSVDGISWESVVSKQAANYSTTIQNYEAIDSYPLPGISYYRLREIDFEGNYTLSDVVAVNLKLGAIQVYPNPAHDIINIRGTNLESFRIIDLTGKELKNQIKLLNESSNLISIDLQELPNGYYLIQANGEVFPFTKK